MSFKSKARFDLHPEVQKILTINEGNDPSDPINRDLLRDWNRYEQRVNFMHHCNGQWSRIYRFELPQTITEAFAQIAIAQSIHFTGGAAQVPLITYSCNADRARSPQLQQAWRVAKRCVTLTMDHTATRTPLTRTISILKPA